MEYMTCGIACYITLTYDDDHLPGDGGVHKKELQNFFKRLRKRLFNERGIKIRYFACGEYGDQDGRPHYHAIVFGVWLGLDLLKEEWGKGFVKRGYCNQKTCSYVAGYVAKKVGSKASIRDKDKPKEFQLMSRRPGIGHDAAVKVIAQKVWKLKNHFQDAPQVISMGVKKMPLGRYMINKIRQTVGFDTVEHKERRLLKLSYEITQEYAEEVKKAKNANRSIRKLQAQKNEGKIQALEKRQEIFNTRR